MEILDKYIEQEPGFKISETHFRLGSKIHISDFFYAKRLFQNSYYASRYAFIVSRYIFKNFPIQNKKSNERITLIGYGIYSELLITLIENYLKKILDIAPEDSTIDHNIISDTEDLKLIKEDYNPNKFIIIVPIASTFSTSIKIEEKLKNEYPNCEIIDTHINILLISHGNINEYETPQKTIQIPDIAKDFGWYNIDLKEKIISLDAFVAKEDKDPDSKSTRKQKYFLSLPTKWSLIEDCEDCFPELKNEKNCTLSDCAKCDKTVQLKKSCPLNEKPLFNTDKTSVTPSLIINYPNGRLIKNEGDKFNISPEVIKFPHWIRDGVHFNFYIKIQEFFTLNSILVRNWLEKDVIEKINCSETDYVIIIAPGHSTNSTFINLVNEVLFSNSANIIHYDPKKDHIQNFKLFYQKELKKATKVIFVDDSISSGLTFTTANRFVCQTRYENEDSKGAFDACIILLNRSSNYIHNNIIQKLPLNETKNEYTYFSFANIHLPQTRDIDGKCTLCKEEERYYELFNNSFLDRTKVHFLKQELKISHHEIDSKNHIINKHNSSICKKIEATHRVFDWYRNSNEATNDHNIENYEKIDDWVTELVSITDSPFNENFINNKDIDIFLKILTQYPFIQYKPIKEKVFRWILERLFKTVLDVYQEINNDTFNYESFRNLKFLIRRAGLLKSNYLISNNMFELLKILYEDKGIIKIKNELEEGNEDDKIKLENIKDFNVFFAAQVKELIFENESRSIRLENLINNFSTPNRYSLKFYQLLRILQEENGLIIKKFWTFLQNNQLWINQVDIKGYDLENIKEKLKNPSIRNHYRYKDLNKFYKHSNEKSIEENEELQRFLYLMTFFNQEKGHDEKLNNKTEYISESIKDIIINSQDNNSGSFLMVKYQFKGEKYFLAYNKGNSRSTIETSINEPDSFLKKFLNGEIDNTDKSFITILELHKDDSNQWKNLYATEDRKLEVVEDLDNGLKDLNCNRLLLVRVNKRYLSIKSEIKDEPQGIIGIYFNQEDEKITAVEKIRYLLLLRPALSKFIEEHHENNEFRDWIESDNRKKTALLTGHGREMLIDIALRYGDKYRNIISTLMLVQRLVLDYNDVDSIGVTQQRVQKVFDGLFFKKEEHDRINNRFIEEIEKIAKDVYSFEEIENSEEVNVFVINNLNEHSSYYFSKDLLNMILFEIFVNAKKNRWIFNEEETFLYKDQTIKINHIYINLSNSQDELIIKVSNTGPEVDCLYDLIRTKNVKPYKTAAGIELIDTILKTFDLGQINFDQETLSKDNRFSLFTVELKLKCINE